MIININNKSFDTNPFDLPENLCFKGTIHTGTSIVENIYGPTKEDVIDLAYQLKELNKDFNTVHLYNSDGEHIGVKFL